VKKATAMLDADKSALEYELRVQMLSLQWKELQYLHRNFQNLATSSAVLVGFGFQALGISSSYHPERGTDHLSIWELPAKQLLSGYFISEVMFQAMFATAASFALAFNLLSLFISTISSMCGPGMALRGPEGSVSLAVRHMEQQLKRALRFFGRGVVAFIITLTFVGLRFLQDIGFLGGSVTVLVGMWTFGACWHYGADIGEKFHVSPDRAVRGTFVSGPGGTSQWQNTEAELAAQTQHSAGLWCCRQRWRPPTHGITTPLWRLDKMIAFPCKPSTSNPTTHSSNDLTTPGLFLPPFLYSDNLPVPGVTDTMTRRRSCVASAGAAPAAQPCGSGRKWRSSC